ncbi:uncharacterized protein C8R40DRAFT_738173 [Lentinula edodes]|uniref:uncharacterized protein n=1 Tax=Lentinula edodes TaxID=5353 RepID=UPI001E8CFDB6|nr:uncharacterized protein C8R40DRAFT_738173 [Lentinula edodes]KAH7869516.1 hypothetical protein C8R40DRAFT_738173 [Lentinula edodes]
MSVTDDLPWPELGNVSRGATRGNQGQKGVLGPPDRDGRCTLQLRVQPGVLAVRLNRQASDWYRTLDNEVNRALKLTKTYWRKARRRQDYDARADQDHMELHEWLQQLKDKTMSHLELLMQKGDIQGPPYTMPDDIELTFLRKFIERQAAGMPHNPRLRNGADPGYIIRAHSVDSGSPDPSDQNYQDQRNRGVDPTEAVNNHMSMGSRPSDSPTLRNPDSLAQEATTSTLQISRAALARAQKDTQDAFLRYTACLDAERQARQSVAAAEKRRDDVMAALLSMNTAEQRSRQSSVSLEEAQAAHALTRYHNEAQDFKNRSNTKPLEWGDAETQGIYATEPMAHLENHGRIVRKHSRTWENGGQLQDHQYGEDLSGLPPRKRIHHMIPGYDVMSNPLQAQNMTLQP